MKIEYDREVDALYVRLQEKFVAKTVQVDEGINIDFDDGGKLIGFEILDATERYALSDIFNALETLVQKVLNGRDGLCEAGIMPRLGRLEGLGVLLGQKEEGRRKMEATAMRKKQEPWKGGIPH